MVHSCFTLKQKPHSHYRFWGRRVGGKITHRKGRIIKNFSSGLRELAGTHNTCAWPWVHPPVGGKGSPLGGGETAFRWKDTAQVYIRLGGHCVASQDPMGSLVPGSDCSRPMANTGYQSPVSTPEWDKEKAH